MSVLRARRALRRLATEQRALFDLPNHRAFVQYLTGLDPLRDTEAAIAQAVEKLDVDILVCSVPRPLKPELADDPNLYGIEPTVWRHHGSTDGNIFGHDPVANRPHLTLDGDGLRAHYVAEDARNRRFVGGTALTHGFLFTTCIHYAAEDLDYEEFLCACALEPERVDGLLDRYEALSARQLHAWMAANPELMLCHDDIANAKALAMRPAFLRERLFPRYRRLFAPIKARGIPLLCMTDGNFLEVAEDYLEAGADGFFLDRPAIELEQLAARCGPERIYFTGPTPEIMTVGSPRAVAREMDHLAELAADLPGFLYHMPGGWVHNMPLENVKTYYRKQGRI